MRQWSDCEWITSTLGTYFCTEKRIIRIFYVNIHLHGGGEMGKEKYDYRLGRMYFCCLRGFLGDYATVTS